jgi:hypothetical protein
MVFAGSVIEAKREHGTIAYYGAILLRATPSKASQMHQFKRENGTLTSLNT